MSEPMSDEQLDELVDVDPLRLRDEAVNLLAEVERLRAGLDATEIDLRQERTVHARTLDERDRLAEQVQRLADNLEATMREWSAHEPTEANACDASGEHNCHLVAGETAFNEAIRQVREIAKAAGS